MSEKNNSDRDFYRSLITTAGAVSAAGSIGVLLFRSLSGILDQDMIAILAGVAGGLTWQIEKIIKKKQKKRATK